MVEELKVKDCIEYLGCDLSFNSKMTYPCWNLPPIKTCLVGKELATIDNSVCNDCYCAKGHYILYAKSITDALYKRLKATTKPDFIKYLSTLLNLRRNNPKTSESWSHIRLHTSGDVYSLEYFYKLLELAKLCPTIKFWLPTKHYVLQQYLDIVPENMVVRFSAPMLDEPFPEEAIYIDKPKSESKYCNRNLDVSKVKCTSTVFTEEFSPARYGHICPAADSHQPCKGCDKCWDGSIKNIAYLEH